MVELLIDHKAERDSRTGREAVTPILFAVQNKRERVVDVLVETGCDITVKSTSQETPKEVAIRMNYGNILKILTNRDEDGPLAETWEPLNHDIDNFINATIVDFFCESDIQLHVTGLSRNSSKTPNCHTKRTMVTLLADRYISPLIM